MVTVPLPLLFPVLMCAAPLHRLTFIHGHLAHRRARKGKGNRTSEPFFLQGQLYQATQERIQACAPPLVYVGRTRQGKEHACLSLNRCPLFPLLSLYEVPCLHSFVLRRVMISFFFLYSLFLFSAFLFALKACLLLRLAPFCCPSPSASLCNACAAVCFHLCSSSIHALPLFFFGNLARLACGMCEMFIFVSTCVFFCMLGCISYMGRLPVLARFVSLTYMFFFFSGLFAYLSPLVCASLFFFFGRVHILLSVLNQPPSHATRLCTGARAAPHRNFSMQVSVVRMRALYLRKAIMGNAVARGRRTCSKVTRNFLSLKKRRLPRRALCPQGVFAVTVGPHSAAAYFLLPLRLLRFRFCALPTRFWCSHSLVLFLYDCVLRCSHGHLRLRRPLALALSSSPHLTRMDVSLSPFLYVFSCVLWSCVLFQWRAHTRPTVERERMAFFIASLNRPPLSPLPLLACLHQFLSLAHVSAGRDATENTRRGCMATSIPFLSCVTLAFLFWLSISSGTLFFFSSSPFFMRVFQV